MVWTSATVAAFRVRLLMTHAAATVWIIDPTLENTPAHHTFRNIGTENGPRIAENSFAAKTALPIREIP